MIGITSSDAQGMGRTGETVVRTFALAGKMKAELGPMDGTSSSGQAAGGDDNDRVLRYMAKLTTRGIGPRDMLRNGRLGRVDVDPATGLVSLDGEPLRSKAAESVSLSRLYFL